MKKSLFTLICVTALTVTSGAYAQDDLGLTVGNDFVTNYVWRGYDVFDDHAAWHPSVDWDVMGTGWHVNVWGAQSIGGANENLTELDYSIYYDNSAFDGEMYQVDYSVGYTYYDFPKDGSDGDLSLDADGEFEDPIADSQEVGIKMAFPNLFGDLGLTPSYYVSKIWWSGGGSSAGFHILALDYAVNVAGYDVALTWDLTYNDGFAGADHDWSHSSFTASTDIEVMENFSVTPFVTYQQTFEDTALNTDGDNELVYGGVYTSFSF